MSTNGSTVFKEQSRHVLRNNASRCLRRTTMVRNYVRRDVGQPESQINSQKLVYKQVMSIPVKRYVLYSAVSSPLDRSKLFTLFLPWQTCSVTIHRCIAITWAGDTCIVSRPKYRDTKKKKKKFNTNHTWLLALFCPFCCPHTAWIVLCIFYCAIQGHFWLIVPFFFRSLR